MTILHKPFRNFQDFWPYYLRQHSKPWCRFWHYLGNFLFLLIFLSAIIKRTLPLVFISVVSAYILAWIGHFFVEKNKPATFQHPLWSLQADFKMIGLFLRGKLHEELAKYIEHKN